MPSCPYLKINLNQCSASSKRNILFFFHLILTFGKKALLPQKYDFRQQLQNFCVVLYEYVCDRPPLFPLKSHLLTLLTPLALGGQVLVDLVALKTHKQEIGPDFHKMHCQEGASSKLQHLCNNKKMSVCKHPMTVRRLSVAKQCCLDLISWVKKQQDHNTTFNHQTSGQS